MNTAKNNLSRPSFLYIALTFLKIGSTAFGGFMALISVVENIIVKEGKLLTPQDMLDGISLATVLPGPVAVNVVVYVGYRLRGAGGALIAGISVLLPTFILILGLSILYFQFGQIPTVNKIFAGFTPAITAIIFSAGWRLGVKAIKDFRAIVLAITSGLLLSLMKGFYITIIILFGSGICGYFLYKNQIRLKDFNQNKEEKIKGLSKSNLIIISSCLITLLILYIIPLPFLANDSLARLFFTFAGMSLILVGGGYVIIPLIQEVVVNGYGWLNLTDFSNGIALGQITPGPILITAAFIGYAVKGFLGATVATIGMFFPPGLLMLACANLLDKIKNSVVIQSSLQGIRPAVVGMIFTAGIIFAQTFPLTWVSGLIFLLAMIFIWITNLDVVFIIPIAGILGLLLY